VTTVSDPQTSKVVPLLQTLARRVESGSVRDGPLRVCARPASPAMQLTLSGATNRHSDETCEVDSLLDMRR
jgi:hypothetical protein